MDNNQEVERLYNQDQDDRARHSAKEIDDLTLWEGDRARLKQTVRLLEENKFKTSKDHWHAAIVFQHGRNENNKRDLEASRLAITMMEKAIVIDPSTNRWLLAAAIDRHYMIANKPQIYGTQYIQNKENKVWEQYDIDTDQISDIERKEYGVETIAQQKETLKRMNAKPLLQKYKEEQDIEAVITYCNAYKNDLIEYDTSWKGMSSFAFQLKRLGKTKEALEIFEASIILFPKEYDLFHSLGWLYIELNRREKGINLLEEAVSLNPNFEEGKRDLEKLKV